MRILFYILIVACTLTGCQKSGDYMISNQFVPEHIEGKWLRANYPMNEFWMNWSSDSLISGDNSQVFVFGKNNVCEYFNIAYCTEKGKEGICRTYLKGTARFNSKNQTFTFLPENGILRSVKHQYNVLINRRVTNEELENSQATYYIKHGRLQGQPFIALSYSKESPNEMIMVKE